MEFEIIENKLILDIDIEEKQLNLEFKPIENSIDLNFSNYDDRELRRLIQENTEDIETIENRLEGFVEDANYVHTDNNFTTEEKNKLENLENYDDTEIKGDISTLQGDVSTLQSTKADKSEIPDVTGFITKDVNDLTYYTLKTNTGSLIDLEINQTTYVVTLSLKDQDGNVISTDTIDLPLENVVVSGSYDSTNEKIVLTLQSGDTVDIPVGALVAGLQSEITSSNKLASDLVDDSNSGHKFVTTSEKQAWNGKYEKPSGGIPSTDMSSAVQTSLGKADNSVQQVSGKGLSTNDYTTAEKTKLAGIEAQANKTVVDNSLSSTSENPVQNKVIYSSQQKQDERTQRILDQLETVTPTKSSNITIEDGADLPLNRFILEGKTEQNSTTGKNLFKPIASATKDGVTFTNNGDGSYTINGTATQNTSFYVNVNYEPGTYTLSANNNQTTNASNYLLLETTNYRKTLIMGVLNKSETYNIQENITALVFVVGINQSFDNFIIKPQLETGSSVTSFEPYTRSDFQVHLHLIHKR